MKCQAYQKQLAQKKSKKLIIQFVSFLIYLLKNNSFIIIQLAKQYHPDTTDKKDAATTKKFQEVSEAYEVLSDETKRKTYDTYGMGGDPFSASQGSYPGARSRGTDPGPGAFRGYEYYQSQVDPEELFRKIFGDAFNRGGFSNHEWSNEAAESQFGQQGISQVTNSYSFCFI